MCLLSNTGECWELDGSYEKDCYHGYPLDLPEYPLTEEMLERAVAPYRSTDRSLHRAFYRARERGVLKVVVLGGSVTYGHGCRTPSGARDVDCAWPERLQEWFDVMLDGFQAEVRERGCCGLLYMRFMYRHVLQQGFYCFGHYYQLHTKQKEMTLKPGIFFSDIFITKHYLALHSSGLTGTHCAISMQLDHMNAVPTHTRVYMFRCRVTCIGIIGLTVCAMLLK